MLLGWLVALKIKYFLCGCALGLWSGHSWNRLSSLEEDCHPARHALLLGLLGVWSARLGTHLLRRCWENRKCPLSIPTGISGRKSLVLSLFSGPGILGGFCQSLSHSRSNPSDLLWTDQVGMFIWIVDLSGSLADKQLRLFKNSPNRTRAEVCNTGLWKYSAILIIFSNGSCGWDTAHGDSFPRWRIALPYPTHSLPLSYQDYRDSFCGGTKVGSQWGYL